MPNDIEYWRDTPVCERLRRVLCEHKFEDTEPATYMIGPGLRSHRQMRFCLIFIGGERGVHFQTLGHGTNQWDNLVGMGLETDRANLDPKDQRFPAPAGMQI